MSPSTKVKVTGIVGAVATAVVAIAKVVNPDLDIPEAVVAGAVTVVVSVLAYFWPESNPSPSAVEAVLAHPSRR